MLGQEENSTGSNAASCSDTRFEYKMFPNKFAGASYIYTISRTIGATASYMVTGRKITNPSVTKPEDILQKNGPSVRSTKTVFNTSEALGEFLYQSSIGFFASFVTRQGSLFLRAPRWSSEICPPCENNSLYNARCNTWTGSALDSYNFDQQPILPRPIKVGEDQRLFTSITNVLAEMQGKDLSIHNNAIVSIGNYSTYEVLSVDNPQTPWLNNPLTWSTDS